MYSGRKNIVLPNPSDALPGRAQRMRVSNLHFVLASPLLPPFPTQYAFAMFGLGCFWGAERTFWELKGVYTTAVGYASGFTPNPTYDEVCTGMTGHNEVVRIVFDPSVLSYSDLLKIFWQSHNPTQGMRQGNDIGTQYRSGIYCYDELQKKMAETSLRHVQDQLVDAGYGRITTEIVPAPEFFYAEDYHQQYLAKNPGGYCGLGGLGFAFEF